MYEESAEQLAIDQKSYKAKAAEKASQAASFTAGGGDQTNYQKKTKVTEQTTAAPSSQDNQYTSRTKASGNQPLRQNTFASQGNRFQKNNNNFENNQAQVPQIVTPSSNSFYSPQSRDQDNSFNSDADISFDNFSGNSFTVKPGNRLVPRVKSKSQVTPDNKAYLGGNSLDSESQVLAESVNYGTGKQNRYNQGNDFNTGVTAKQSTVYQPSTIYPQGSTIQQNPQIPPIQQPSNFAQILPIQQANYVQTPSIQYPSNYVQGSTVQQSNYPQSTTIQQSPTYSTIQQAAYYPQVSTIQQTANYPQVSTAQQAANYPQSTTYQQSNPQTTTYQDGASNLATASYQQNTNSPQSTTYQQTVSNPQTTKVNQEITNYQQSISNAQSTTYQQTVGNQQTVSYQPSVSNSQTATGYEQGTTAGVAQSQKTVSPEGNSSTYVSNTSPFAAETATPVYSTFKASSPGYTAYSTIKDSAYPSTYYYNPSTSSPELLSNVNSNRISLDQKANLVPETINNAAVENSNSLDIYYDQINNKESVRLPVASYDSKKISVSDIFLKQENEVLSSSVDVSNALPSVLTDSTKEGYTFLFSNGSNAIASAGSSSQSNNDLATQQNQGIVPALSANIGSYPAASTTTTTVAPIPKATESEKDLELRHSSDLRELAQVFSRALSAYLEDPENFRRILSEVRPTEPNIKTTTVNPYNNEVLEFSEDNKISNDNYRTTNPTTSPVYTTLKEEYKSSSIANQVNNLVSDNTASSYFPAAKNLYGGFQNNTSKNSPSPYTNVFQGTTQTYYSVSPLVDVTRAPEVYSSSSSTPSPVSTVASASYSESTKLIGAQDVNNLAPSKSLYEDETYDKNNVYSSDKYDYSFGANAKKTVQGGLEDNESLIPYDSQSFVSKDNLLKFQEVQNESLRRFQEAQQKYYDTLKSIYQAQKETSAQNNERSRITYTQKVVSNPSVASDYYYNEKVVSQVVPSSTAYSSGDYAQTETPSSQYYASPSPKYVSLSDSAQYNPSTASPQYNSPTSSAQYNSATASAQYNSPTASAQNNSPSASPQYNSPTVASQYNSPNTASVQYESSTASAQYNTASPQYNSPTDSPQYNSVNTASAQYDSPTASPQYYSATDLAQYNSPTSNSALANQYDTGSMYKEAKELFGSLNETSANMLMDVMREAESNTTLRRLVLLLVNDKTGKKTPEETRNKLLEALLQMPQRVPSYPPNSIRSTYTPKVPRRVKVLKSRTLATNEKSSTKYQRDTHVNYAQPATNQKVALLPEKLGSESDSRAVELLRSLYVLAAKWG